MKLNHSFVSAVADDADSSTVSPSDWNANLSVTVQDGEGVAQPTRWIVTSTDRLTAAGTGRLRIFDVLTGMSGAYSLGSTTIQSDGFLLQYKRATFSGNARLNAVGTAELYLFDLAPVGRLVLAGRGG